LVFGIISRSLTEQFAFADGGFLSDADVMRMVVADAKPTG